MSFLASWRDYWSPKEEIDTSPRISDEVKYTTCYMCACRCGIKVHLKDGGIRFIEGNPTSPGQSRRDMRQGRLRHYAAIFAGQADEAAVAGRRARRRRVPRDRVGRGDRDGAVMAVENPRRRPEKARLLHRPRSEPVVDRVLGDPVRHAEFRGAWRVLLGQHGRGRACTRSAAASGNSASPTGSAPSFF